MRYINLRFTYFTYLLKHYDDSKRVQLLQAPGSRLALTDLAFNDSEKTTEMHRPSVTSDIFYPQS